MSGRPTFELTIHRCLEPGVFPVVAELVLPAQDLPFRAEGRLALNDADREELAARTSASDYGAFLGGALFKGETLRAWDQAVSQCGGGMHVLLAVEAPELRVLHWEWLNIPVDGTFRPIAVDQRFPYCLYQPSKVDRRFPPFGRRDLRMLAVVASPGGLGKYSLESFDEERALRTVVDALQDKIEYDVLATREDLPGRIGPPSLSGICAQLTAQRYTLVHFIAHGRLNRDGETVVYLSDDAGEVHAVPALDLLARLAQLAVLPHFIFLAVCESAKPEAEAALGGLGQRLVRELGIPTVLAMTRKVSHFLAYELSKRLYPQLLEHGDVAQALVESCAGLAGETDVTVPALYSRLGGRPLFRDDLDGRELTGAEIAFGLDRLLELFAERAPVLTPRVLELANKVRATLGLDARVIPVYPPVESKRSPDDLMAQAGRKLHRAAKRLGRPRPAGSAPSGRGSADPETADGGLLSEAAKKEQQQTLAEIETLSLHVLDMRFAAVALGHKAPVAPSECPFPGMRAFSPDDQRYFFGRDALVEALLRRIKAHPFLAVLGASGSGKSSVIRAGLLPRLRRETPELREVTITPGSDPRTQLTAALARAGLPEDGAPKAVLFVDQFEEIFTLCTAETRKLFIKQLFGLQQVMPVVLTMRADFWGECAEHPELRQLMQEHLELVTRMTGHELRGTIEQQARAAGLRLEPGLGEKIVEDVQSEPGAMPLLQHALLKLWERRHGPWLSAAEYEAIGGVQSAIAETADSIYGRLTDLDRARMRTVFLRLTHVDDAAVVEGARRYTRRRMAYADLIPAGAESAPYVTLITHLADARLLVTSTSPSTQQDEAEVVHEALIRNWPRLAAWLEEQRDSLALREAVNKAAREWRAHKCNRQWLVHSGSRLRESMERVERFPGMFNQAEHDYLGACQSYAQRTRLSWAALVLAIVGIACGFLVFAVLTRREQLRGGSKLTAAMQARGSAEGRHAGTLAALLALEPGARLRPLDLGVQAVAPFYKQRLVPPAESLAGLRDGLMVATFARPLIDTQAEAVTAIALSADGTLLASVGTDRQLRLFDAHSGTQLRSISSETAPRAVLFSPLGDRLYVAGSDGAVRLYDRGGQLLFAVDAFPVAVLALALTADGARLAAGSEAGQISLFELTDLRHKLKLTGHQGAVRALAFTSDGTRLVSGGADGTLQLFDLTRRHPRPQVIKAHRGAITAVAVVPRSSTVISGGDDRLVRQWDVTDGKPLADGLPVGVPVRALAVDPHGVLAVGDREGNTTVWLLGVRAPLWSIDDDAHGRTAAAISGLAFPPEPGRLVVAATDGLIRVWNVPRTLIVSYFPDHEAPVTAVDCNPDHSRCLTASRDGSLRIYEAPGGRLLSQVGALGAPVVAAAFAPPGQVTVLTRKGTVTRYREDTGQLVTQQPLPILHVTAARIERTARRVAIAASHDVQVWDLVAGRLVQNLPHPDQVQAATVAADGRRVASAAMDQRIRVFDVDSGRLLYTLEAPGGVVQALAFAGNQYLLSSGVEQPLRLWDLGSGRAAILPSDNSHKQIAIAASADGRRAAVASAHGLITLWDLNRRQPLLFLRTRQPLLRTATLSEDGRYVLSGGHDGASRLFAIDPALLWRVSCETLAVTIRCEDDTQSSWEQARAACAATPAPETESDSPSRIEPRLP